MEFASNLLAFVASPCFPDRTSEDDRADHLVHPRLPGKAKTQMGLAGGVSVRRTSAAGLRTFCLTQAVQPH